ncbi:hypothetical protein Tco_1108331 [Tanacetum coccineum]
MHLLSVPFQKSAIAEINFLLDILNPTRCSNIHVSDLEKDVKVLKQVDHTLVILESIKSEVPESVNKYLGSTLGDTLQKVNILKSIDEGPFQMGTTRVIVAEGTEGSLNLGPKRPRVYSNLSRDEKDRIGILTKAKACESQLYDDFEHFRQNKGETIHNYYVRWHAGYGRSQKRVGTANPGKFEVSATTATRRPHSKTALTQAIHRTLGYFKDKGCCCDASSSGMG